MIKAKGEWVPAHLMLRLEPGSAQPWQPRDLPSGLPIVLGPPETLLVPQLPFLGLGAGSVRSLEEMGC